MFTINIYVRFALIALTLIGGTIMAITYSFWYAFPILLIGIALLVGYFLFGTIQSASLIMQKGDMEGASKRLDMTYMPNWLYKTNRAMFYILRGSIAGAQKDMEASEMWLQKAKAIDLPTDNEKAMVEIQLASININKGKWQAAQKNFRFMKKLKITEPQILEQYKQLEQVMNQRGQIKQSRRQGGQQMGGKRRRPKMK